MPSPKCASPGGGGTQAGIWQGGGQGLQKGWVVQHKLWPLPLALSPWDAQTPLPSPPFCRAKFLCLYPVIPRPPTPPPQSDNHHRFREPPPGLSRGERSDTSPPPEPPAGLAEWASTLPPSPLPLSRRRPPVLGAPSLPVPPIPPRFVRLLALPPIVFSQTATMLANPPTCPQTGKIHFGVMDWFCEGPEIDLKNKKTHLLSTRNLPSSFR